MDNPNKSIQELILNMLSSRRAVKHSDLGESVEKLINESDTCDRKVKPIYVINRTIKKMISDDIIEEHETDFSSFLSPSLEASGFFS